MANIAIMAIFGKEAVKGKLAWREFGIMLR
jgi:hypothetical protein